MNEQNEIVLYQPNEHLQLQVRLEHDTVWLNRNQIAQLFGRDVKTIGKHITNALREELSLPIEIVKGATIAKNATVQQYPTVAKFATVQQEGPRSVVRQVEYYSLDVILSVGYRVKSGQGIAFRRWANTILKDYLLRGYAINQRLLAMEERIDCRLSAHEQQLAEHEKKIDFFVRTSLPPVEGVFYDGQIFDAYVFVADLIKGAQQSVVLIDNYVDESVLTMLDKRLDGVSATIYTQTISKQLQLDINKHNAQYRPIRVEKCKSVHDRFLLIDNTVYHIGASIKDLGKKLFAFSKMEITAKDILKQLN